MNASSWGNAAPAANEFAATMPQSAAQRLDIRFTGSGSEYFRIWIVNLLLTLVTLTLYHPWAKVRRLRYFHGNTLVGGHALDFHGDPKKMLRGYLLAGAMVLLYSVAGNVSPTAGVVSLGIVAALWPALLKSSTQFRMANTSWRGLRFAFRGSLGGAYAALLPLFVPGLLVLGVSAIADGSDRPLAWAAFVIIGVSLSAMLVVPWLWWNLKKYQHDHYALGQEQTRLDAGVGSFYGVFLKTFGIVLLVMLGGGAVIGALVWSTQERIREAGELGAVAGLAGFVPIVLMILVLTVPRPFFVSRMQNLLWSRTASAMVQFRSTLRFGPLFRLTLKNWLLTVVTLGLYSPFAAVAMARLKLQAVEIEVDGSLDQLLGQAADAGDAVADAAGDFFGIDIGL